MKILLSTILVFSLSFPGCKSSDKAKEPVIVQLPPITSTVSVKENDGIGKYSYDLKTPNKSWKLPKELIEVSGNTWVDENHLILIEDIHPNLYLLKINGTQSEVEKIIPFQKDEKNKFDIEDVTIVNNIVYALWSHGVLFKISSWNEKPAVEKISTSLNKQNNTEGLCYDPVTQDLLIACKGKSGIPDAKKSTKAVYQINPEIKKLDQKPFLIIKKDDFEKLSKEKISFNPSAIAIHPVTHDIYLLSTLDNKCMAVYNRDGQLISFQFIDQDLMPQPEGICFSPDGKLFISSEGKKGEPANLFEFDAKTK